MKMIDVGLKKENYVEEYVDLMEHNLPLSVENNKKLNDFINSKVILSEYDLFDKRPVYSCSWFSRPKKEVYLYDNYSVMFVQFFELYKGKLLHRIFAIRRKLDRRKKVKQKIDYMEVFRCLEGNYYGIAFSCQLYNTLGNGMRVYFHDESIDDIYPAYRSYYSWVHTWSFVPYNYFTSVNGTFKLYDVNDLIKLVPELKYSQIEIYNNPIYYLNYYRMCPGIELLKKCDFVKLLKSKRCLDRLNKGDKGFMKLLYQMHQHKCTGYDYNFYSSYYNKYKIDMSKLEYYKFRDKIKNKLFTYRNQFCNEYCYYYNTNKIKIDFVLEDTCKYLFKQKEEFSYYKDYLEMCLKVGHDIEDQYWRYPNNLSKAHNKVMQELENVRKLESHLRYDYLNEVLKDLMQYNITTSNGYEVFVSSDLDIIQKQCDVLYQCLIRNDYVMKEVMQEIILVFLWKDGTPVATAEVHYDGSVGQFYSDERDRQKCLATPEMWDALNEWLEQVKLVKRSCDTKIKYYKGFHKKTEDGRFYTSFGDTYFEIGKVYETPFDDEFIISQGGNRCVASNKVFHFCDSIEEISKHYNPTCYCIVEPLGPVLECNGALLTNRLKIVKEIVVL